MSQWQNTTDPKVPAVPQTESGASHQRRSRHTVRLLYKGKGLFSLCRNVSLFLKIFLRRWRSSLYLIMLEKLPCFCSFLLLLSPSGGQILRISPSGAATYTFIVRDQYTLNLYKSFCILVDCAVESVLFILSVICQDFTYITQFPIASSSFRLFTGLVGNCTYIC